MAITPPSMQCFAPIRAGRAERRCSACEGCPSASSCPLRGSPCTRSAREAGTASRWRSSIPARRSGPFLARAGSPRAAARCGCRRPSRGSTGRELVVHGDDGELHRSPGQFERDGLAGRLAEQLARKRRIDAQAALLRVRLVGPYDLPRCLLAGLVAQDDVATEDRAALAPWGVHRQKRQGGRERLCPARRPVERLELMLQRAKPLGRHVPELSWLETRSGGGGRGRPGGIFARDSPRTSEK